MKQQMRNSAREAVRHSQRARKATISNVTATSTQTASAALSFSESKASWAGSARFSTTS